MIETIDQITLDDLFNGLGDQEFIRKLFDAAEKRIQHHNEWLDFHNNSNRPDGVSREYHKVKGYMSLTRGALSLLKD